MKINQNVNMSQSRGVVKKVVMVFVLTFLLVTGGWSWHQAGEYIKLQKALSLRNTAKSEIVNGNLENAESLYRRAIAVKSSSSTALYAELGDFLIEHKKLEEAEVLYKKAVREVKPPDSARLYVYLAAIKVRQGQTDNAIENLRAALKIDPNIRSLKTLDPVLADLWGNLEN